MAGGPSMAQHSNGQLNYALCVCVCVFVHAHAVVCIHAHACGCCGVCVYMCVCDGYSLQLDEGIRNVLCIPIYSNDEEVIGECHKTCRGVHQYSCPCTCSQYVCVCMHCQCWCLSIPPICPCSHALCTAGVAQMANKANGLPFTIADQESLEVCHLYRSD